MKVKIVLVSLFMVVAFVGFVTVGPARASLDFIDWAGTWFKVTASETGKAGPVVPLGGSVITDNEKNFTTYLFIDTWNLSDTSYSVVYCTFNGTVWTRHTELEWPVLGGEPENFLTFFNFSYQETQAITETYWIPLLVTGKEVKNSVGEIKSASFQNLGGIFYEEIGTPIVTSKGVGSVKFKGSFIKADKVTTVVPPGCRI